MFNNFYLKCINSLLVYTYKKNVKQYGFTPRGLFGIPKNLKKIDLKF